MAGIVLPFPNPTRPMMTGHPIPVDSANPPRRLYAKWSWSPDGLTANWSTRKAAIGRWCSLRRFKRAAVPATGARP